MLRAGADDQPVPGSGRFTGLTDFTDTAGRPDGAGMSPWFRQPGAGTAPRWGFPNPFEQFRTIAADTPLWPIGPGGAAVATPAAAAAGDETEPPSYLNPTDALTRWAGAIEEVSTNRQVIT